MTRLVFITPRTLTLTSDVRSPGTYSSLITHHPAARWRGNQCPLRETVPLAQLQPDNNARLRKAQRCVDQAYQAYHLNNNNNVPRAKEPPEGGEHVCPEFAETVFSRMGCVTYRYDASRTGAEHRISCCTCHGGGANHQRQQRRQKPQVHFRLMNAHQSWGRYLTNIITLKHFFLSSHRAEFSSKSCIARD
jgi:hypothetical protein